MLLILLMSHTFNKPRDIRNRNTDVSIVICYIFHKLAISYTFLQTTTNMVGI